MLMDIGYHLGNYLNHSADNLWYTLLFKRINILDVSDKEFSQLLDILTIAICTQKKLSAKQIKIIDQLANTTRTQHGQEVLKAMAESIKNNTNEKIYDKWGWKEPNSHIIIKQLKQFLPTMKYIHVIRNGLDMAYSDNQNQMIFWGQHYFKKELKVTAKNSLKYWCKVHKNLIENTQTMSKDFYLLNFDEFCQDPVTGLVKLGRFLETELSNEKVEKLVELVKPPKSIGRYKTHDINEFDSDDIAFVKKLGFDTE